jgi:predicted Zn-dependent protease
MQSHPMPAERVRALEGMARQSPHWDKKDPPALQSRHELARAIASYRFGNVQSALQQIDGLIQAQPQNPYFHELKGQALLEAGRPADAIAPLRRAVQLAPNPALIQIMLAQAILASNNKAMAEEAVTLLETAIRREPESAEAFDQIALAYGRKGDLARADLASAQASFTRGDLITARALAGRAKSRFPVGSPGWVKADDIASYKPRGNPRN